jgi:hypothetical protein
LVLEFYWPPEPAGNKLPFTLTKWHRILTCSLALPDALATFLREDASTTVYADPPMQLAVKVEGAQALDELIATDSGEPVPGTMASSSFFDFAVSDAIGDPADLVGVTFLRTWCDYALHVHGYETELDAIPINPPRMTRRASARSRLGALVARILGSAAPLFKTARRAVFSTVIFLAAVATIVYTVVALWPGSVNSSQSSALSVTVVPSEGIGGAPVVPVPGDWTPSNYLSSGTQLTVDCRTVVDREFVLAHISGGLGVGEWIQTVDLRLPSGSRINGVDLSPCGTAG